uniref:Uncharacterized protein n=1 Tax=Neovison vison TaxID=452646 RepID=A0A8C7BA79_NEOVI
MSYYGNSYGGLGCCYGSFYGLDCGYGWGWANFPRLGHGCGWRGHRYGCCLLLCYGGYGFSGFYQTPVSVTQHLK